MSKRKRLPAATTMITQVMPSVSQGVEIDLADTDYVVGVSYSAKRRMWRAYLHIGKKQVFHRWCDSKSEAIRAHRQAVIDHQRLSAIPRAAGVPFERSVKAPKYRDLDSTLLLLTKQAIAVVGCEKRVFNDGLKAKHVESGERNGTLLGRAIGGVIAITELLVLDGAVLAVDIEIGMKMTVEILKEVYS
jgi:hypothetical protein